MPRFEEHPPPKRGPLNQLAWRRLRFHARFVCRLVLEHPRVLAEPCGPARYDEQGNGECRRLKFPRLVFISIPPKCPPTPVAKAKQRLTASKPMARWCRGPYSAACTTSTSG